MKPLTEILHSSPPMSMWPPPVAIDVAAAVAIEVIEAVVGIVMLGILDIVGMVVMLDMVDMVDIMEEAVVVAGIDIPFILTGVE